MTNNELSRRVLEVLAEGGGKARFRELVEKVGADAKSVFKNLFFLEERGFVRLATSIPADAVYPHVHLVVLRDAGRELVENPEKMEAVFPLSESLFSIDPGVERKALPDCTFAEVLKLLAIRVSREMEGEQKEELLEKIEALLKSPVVHTRIPEKPAGSSGTQGDK